MSALPALLNDARDFALRSSGIGDVPHWETTGIKTRWSPRQRAQLAALSGQLTDSQLAERLGKTTTAVKAMRYREGLPSRRQELVGSDVLCSTADIAAALGIGCSKTVIRWLEAGLIPYSDAGYEYEWRVIRRRDLIRFALNPDNWILFDTERVADPHIARLIELRRPRVDEWLDTTAVAAMLTARDELGREFDVKDVTHQIAIGRLPAIQRPDADGLAWSRWYVRRSDAEQMEPLQSIGGKTTVTVSPDERAFVIIGCAIGLTKPTISRLRRDGQPRRAYYLAERCLDPADLHAFVASRPDLAAVRVSADNTQVYADWRAYAGRIHSVAAAWRRFAAGQALSELDRTIINGFLHSWGTWHATTPAQHKTARALRWSSKAHVAHLRKQCRALRDWFPPDSAETEPLRRCDENG